MRKKRQKQMPLMHTSVDHPHAQELELISAFLESHPTIDELALQDLTADVMFANCGAEGMSAELDKRLEPRSPGSRARF